MADAFGDLLPREFFTGRRVQEIAVDLLGRVLLSRVGGALVAIRLTEVEAYQGMDDPGSHAYRGPTARCSTMFGPPGHVYVYFTYGMHWCMNLVCAPVGTASAVLLRAGEVVAGEEIARARRPAARADRDLARGPARLAAALGVDRSLDGADVVTPGGLLEVRSGCSAVPPSSVRSGPRTGLAGAGAAFPWRYWQDGETSVSPYRPAAPRARRLTP